MKNNNNNNKSRSASMSKRKKNQSRGNKPRQSSKISLKPTAFNKQGVFKTLTTYSAAINVAALTTALRVDIIPTLNLFPI